jgi:pyruvate kinase
MLDSMERNLLPTRAEVTDVFYSVNIGADSSMTSGETAAGLFPVNSIQTMNKINVESEQTFDYEGAIELFKKNVKLAGNAYGKAVIEIAKKCVPSVKKGVAAYPYEFISVFTNEDILIKALSTIRPAAAIIVVTDDEKAYTKYGALYGVKTYLVDDLASAEESAAETLSKAINNYASVMGDGTINNKNVPTILTSGTKEITVKTIKIN